MYYSMKSGKFADYFFFGKIVTQEIANLIRFATDFESGGIIGDGRNALKRLSAA